MALRGLKVVEMLGLAPGPFCGMVLLDFGATVTVVHKIGPVPFDVMSNGKKMLSVNLKSQEGINIIKKICVNADVIIDTYRPGIMEKLGLGPSDLIKENPRLIYARLTGFGQYGKYKEKAGHDINYIALSGILSLLTKNKEPPVPPINLMADFAGGGLICALGILLALYERTTSGRGQVIDASMVEGTQYVGSWLLRSRNLPIWTEEPGNNMLDGGAPFYSTYKTKDGKFMAVGALEPQFYSQFVKGLGLSETEYSQFSDPIRCRLKFEEIFLTKTQKEWSLLFENLDACVTPVLELNNIFDHDLNVTRKSLQKKSDGTIFSKPAPVLSRTPGISHANKPTSQPGEHTTQILKELGYNDMQIEKFINDHIIYAMKKCSL